MLCNHHRTIQFQNFLTILKGNYTSSHPPISSSPQPLGASYLLSVSMDWEVLEISYKWNHTYRPHLVFCLASFTQHHAFSVHPCWQRVSVPHSQQCMRVLVSLHPQHLFYFFSIMITLVGVKRYLIMVLICVSLMPNDVEHLSVCLLAFCVCSLELHFSKIILACVSLDCLLAVELKEFFLYHGQWTPIRCMLCKYFKTLPPYGLSFHSRLSFDAQLFISRKSNYLYFAFGAVFGEPCQIQGHES